MSDMQLATELDAQIQALVARRSRMRPSPSVLPSADPTQIYHADNMLWHVRPAARAAAIEIILYHSGLGWVGVVMSRAQVEDMQNTMLLAIRDLPIVLNGTA
jgi:hypothetical protein